MFFIQRNKRLVMAVLILFAVPLISGAALGYEMSQDRIEAIPTVVMDHDQSEFSRTLVDFVAESEIFQVVGYADSDQEVERQIFEGNAYVGMIIPEGLFAEMRLGQAPEVLVFYDGTSMPVASGARAAMSEILQTVKAAYMVKVYEGKLNAAEGQAIKMARPVDATYRILYNPTRSYRNFFIPGLLVAIIQVGIVIIGLERAKEGETKFPTDIRKILVTGLLGVLSISVCMAVQNWFFEMPFRGSLAAFAVLTLLFSSCMAAFGYIFGKLIPDKVLSTQLACVCVLPAAVLGGYTFPLMAMPEFFQIFSRLIPLSYYGDDLRNLTVKEIGIPYLAGDILYFLIFFGIEVGILFAVSLLRGRIKNGEHDAHIFS